MLGPSSARGGGGSPGSCPGYPTHCVTAVSGQLGLKVRVTPCSLLQDKLLRRERKLAEVFSRTTSCKHIPNNKWHLDGD